MKLIKINFINYYKEAFIMVDFLKKYWDDIVYIFDLIYSIIKRNILEEQE